ncbi:MAG: hypothetical protein ACLT98_13290, partial [Eggerthellaceae bacterium]
MQRVYDALSDKNKGLLDDYLTTSSTRTARSRRAIARRTSAATSWSSSTAASSTSPWARAKPISSTWCRLGDADALRARFLEFVETRLADERDREIADALDMAESVGRPTPATTAGSSEVAGERFLIRDTKPMEFSRRSSSPATSSPTCSPRSTRSETARFWRASRPPTTACAGAATPSRTPSEARSATTAANRKEASHRRIRARRSWYLPRAQRQSQPSANKERTGDIICHRPTMRPQAPPSAHTARQCPSAIKLPPASSRGGAKHGQGNRRGTIVQLEKDKPKSKCRKWQLRVPVGLDPRTGKYKTRTRRVNDMTYTQAKKALRDFIEEIEDDRVWRRTGTTFEECAADFMERRDLSGEFSQNTQLRYRRCFKAVSRHIGKAEIALITPEMIEDMYAAMRQGDTLSGKPSSGAYLNQINKTLDLMFRDLVEREVSMRNPID